mgnify:FL=1
MKLFALAALVAITATSASAWTTNQGGKGGSARANQEQTQSTDNSNNSNYTSRSSAHAPSVSGVNKCSLGVGLGVAGLDSISLGFQFAGRKCVVLREANSLFNIMGGGAAGRNAWITHMAKNDARVRRTMIAAGIVVSK